MAASSADRAALAIDLAAAYGNQQDFDLIIAVVLVCLFVNLQDAYVCTARGQCAFCHPIVSQFLLVYHL